MPGRRADFSAALDANSDTLSKLTALAIGNLPRPRPARRTARGRPAAGAPAPTSGGAGLRQAGVADRLQMAMVRAAASAENGKASHAAAQVAITPAEIGRIAGVKLSRRVELGVAFGRRVGAHAA